MMELVVLAWFIGGIAWIQQRAFWHLYQKTTGHTAPKKSDKQARGVLALTGIAMCAAML